MTLVEYFQQHRPQARYSIGDRLGGRYQGIPWVGTVGSDTLRNWDEGPRVSIHLDLPMRLENGWVTIIRVSYSDILEQR